VFPAAAAQPCCVRGVRVKDGEFVRHTAYTVAVETYDRIMLCKNCTLPLSSLLSLPKLVTKSAAFDRCAEDLRIWTCRNNVIVMGNIHRGKTRAQQLLRWPTVAKSRPELETVNR